MKLRFTISLLLFSTKAQMDMTEEAFEDWKSKPLPDEPHDYLPEDFFDRTDGSWKEQGWKQIETDPDWITEIPNPDGGKDLF